MIHVIAVITAQPGKRDAILEAFRANVPAVHAEAGCIEYGAAVLGTKVIMVLAHGNCGAVKATIEGTAVPGQISSLYRYIRPAGNQAGAGLRAAADDVSELTRKIVSEL